MSAALALVVVAVEELAGPADRFRCVPYAATITASTCLERQARHGTKRPPRPGSVSGRCPPPLDFGRCRDCTLGRAVVARLTPEETGP